MLFLIRFFSNQAKFFPAKCKISLTPEESNLFSTLIENLPKTELRVAGGWVRDKLLNLNSQDIDISLNNLTGTQAAEILKSNLPNSSSLGVVKPNPAASKHLETACIKILGFQLDLVNLRSEVYTDSRIPSIIFGTPSEDAYRRDLTINSLFYNLNTKLVEDWTGFGLSDLEQKWARTPLNPKETLKDDPLRALRILRFAARFDLKICPEVESALKEPSLKAHLLKKVSRERVKIEYEKMILGKNCESAIELIEKFEFFDIIFGIDGIKVKDALSQLGEFKHSKLSFEKYTAGLLMKFAPKSVSYGEGVLKISDYVGDISLKLSKKQKEVIGKFIEFVPEIEKLSNQFNVIEAGLIIKELGECWEEALDLLPPVLSHAFFQSVQSNSLTSFYNEPPLLKGDEIQALLKIPKHKISFYVKECVKWQAQNRAGTREQLISYLLPLGQWEYRPIEGEDTTIIYCQFYRKPCKNPTLFPVPRRSASVILYRTWEQADINNLCPGDSCGPFCNTTDPTCFIDYRIPKSSTDLTPGGRDLPLAGGSTEPVGYLNDTFCPPNCCNTENCKRYRDINGSPVPTNHEILLVFGGTALRNVTLNGTLLFNDCTEQNIELAKKDYRLEVTQSCGIEILNEIWRYDIKNDSWNYLQPSYHPDNSNYSFPYPRHSHRAVLVELLIYDTLVKAMTLKKYMYVYGGFALECRDACDDMWRFEIPWASQTYYPKSSGFWNRGGYWEQLTQSYSPGRRMSHNLVVSQDFNYLYLFGGLGKNLLYKDLWRYTVPTNTWQELVTYGISKVSRKVNTWNGTEYDLILNISDKRLNDTITYSATGSKPVERMSACLLYFASSFEYIFLFGGLGTRVRLFNLGNASIALNDFWVYSVSSHKWTQIFSDTDGPSERYEANIIQIDTTRLAVYGGRHGEVVFEDFWAYNIETNHWFNWTKILKTSDYYPEARYKGSLIRTSEGLVIYSGSYTGTTNLSETDLSTEEYMTYTSECQEILNFYDVSIYDIGKDEFAEEQLRLYLLSGSSCFLRTDPIPLFKGTIKYLQGVWVFNLNACESSCNGNGFCEFGTCYCYDGFFGVLCEFKTCPGTFCIYDNEFFSTSECVHCSGYGECLDGLCNCTDGYSGDDCSKQTCRDDCNFDGNCVEMYPISQCDCYGKFGGDTCQVVLCLNNCNEPYGSCNITTGICTCIEGFYGIDCSVVGVSFARFILPLGLGVILVV